MYFAVPDAIEMHGTILGASTDRQTENHRVWHLVLDGDERFGIEVCILAVVGVC